MFTLVMIAGFAVIVYFGPLALILLVGSWLAVTFIPFDQHSKSERPCRGFVEAQEYVELSGFAWAKENQESRGI